MSDAIKLAEIVSKLFHQCLEHETRQTRQYDVSLAEGRCLRILNENNKLSVHQLAEKMSLASSRITRIIDSLVKKDLVIRESNLADRRVYFLSMTPRGQQLTHEMQNDYIQFYQLILDQTPESRRLLFINMLQEFYQIMTKVTLFK
ncbi:MarR family transcriptional regulator [candidate division KSB1 bacterium]|nr:MarR family transcriptional regulator [candidate division KSB1 bacterium]